MEKDIKTISQLLQDKAFATKIAKRQHDAYYLQNGETPTPFSEEKENIAINLAGFYALECGLDYLVTVQNLSVTEVLNAIASDTINAANKDLLCRFANATWKAGQPFRNLDRITRPVFIPFSSLPKEETAKDWKQITVAAEMILEALNESNS